jgi:hypothetical protein
MSRRFRTRFIGTTTLASLVLFAARASGDPVLITSGGVTMVTPSLDLDPPFGFALSGPDLSFQSSFFNFVAASGTAGSPMSLSGGVAIQNPPFHTSAVVVNGTPFSGMYPAGSLSFAAVPFVLPPATDLAAFHFTTPFTMIGNLEGFSDSLRATAPLFDVNVAGSGVASVTGVVHGNGAAAVYVGQIVDYSFSPASPTPEPSSVALCGGRRAALLATPPASHPELTRRTEATACGRAAPNVGSFASASAAWP